MKVQDALLTGELSKGTVIAGNDGLSREVDSVEVMEVPDVVTWVTPGILVMTAFYSIKDNPIRQTEIVQSLIDIGAAGIVIKIGRFIDSIPDDMIELAHKNQFPIIVIPKEISYINILRPLFEKLYDEKQIEIEKRTNPFYELQKTYFSSLVNAMDAISKIIESAVYIEDLEGHLLYVTKGFRWDGWRTSSSLFSKPVRSKRNILKERKQEIHTATHLHVDIQGFRNRLLLPLTSKNNVFAIAHFPYKDKVKFKDIPDKYMKKMGSQLSELFMNDQLYLQKKHLKEIELTQQKLGELEKDSRKQLAIVYYYTNWRKDLSYPSSHVIDYSSLTRRNLYELNKQLNDCDVLVFENNHKFYGLIDYNSQSYSEMVKQWGHIIDRYNEKTKTNRISISISSPFKNVGSLDNTIHSVTKMMQIGLNTKPKESVYTYDQLGIYDILLNLTTDKSVISYVNNILRPLKDDQGELIKTLEIYLDENGNISKTSKRLYIHRRTLTYRIRKIEELLNMNLNDSSNRFILNFCLKMKELS